MKTKEEIIKAIKGKTPRQVESYFRENYPLIEKTYWNYISQYVRLSDEFINEFADHLDLFCIARFQNRPAEFRITFNSLLSYRQIGRTILFPLCYAKNTMLDYEIEKYTLI